jgi:hypothetical protein
MRMENSLQSSDRVVPRDRLRLKDPGIQKIFRPAAGERGMYSARMREAADKVRPFNRRSAIPLKFSGF